MSVNDWLGIANFDDELLLLLIFFSRTDILKCNSDMDYLVKLHSLRLAFKVLV